MKLDDVASTDDVGWQFVSTGLPHQGTTVTIYDLKMVVALVIFDLNIESSEVYDNDLPLLYFYHIGQLEWVALALFLTLFFITFLKESSTVLVKNLGMTCKETEHKNVKLVE